MYDEWVLTHRVDLHNALRSIAAKDIDGRKIDVRLSSPVISVVSRVRSIFSGTVTDQVGSKDAEKGEVMLGDGSKYVGDLVVGADGVHVSIAQMTIDRDEINRDSPTPFEPSWEKTEPL